MAGPFGSAQDTERIEAALLYIIAGYDANAALTVKAIEPVPDTLPDSEIAAWSLGMILRLLRLMPVEDIPSLHRHPKTRWCACTSVTNYGDASVHT